MLRKHVHYMSLKLNVFRHTDCQKLTIELAPVSADLPCVTRTHFVYHARLTKSATPRICTLNEVREGKDEVFDVARSQVAQYSIFQILLVGGWYLLGRNPAILSSLVGNRGRPQPPCGNYRGGSKVLLALKKKQLFSPTF